jgi:haloalkane dehalogenase
VNTIRKGYVDIPEGQVHYLACGPTDGIPLVLLHATSDAASMWEAVLPLFGERGYRAIAFDIPGHGNSFRPAQQPSALDYAAMMHAATSAMRIGPSHLLGHHFGATVAGLLAAEYPDDTRSLSLYGWPNVGDAFMKSIASAGPREFPADGTTVREHWVRRWAMSGMGLDNPSDSRFSEALGVRTLVALLQSGRNWFWAYRAIGESNHRALAKRVTCPVLLFAGPRDHLWHETQDAVADFSNARFVPMDWVGVDAADEEPEAFCTIVDRFIHRDQESTPGVNR